MSLCTLEKIRTLEVARFQYERIVNSKDDPDSLSKEELAERINTLEAIQKVEPILKQIAQEVEAS
jgi:hypothetical protein